MPRPRLEILIEPGQPPVVRVVADSLEDEALVADDLEIRFQGLRLDIAFALLDLKEQLGERSEATRPAE
jgi:hypothetical protein